MTVTDLTNEVTAAGTGSKTDFDFDFKIQNESDIEVYKVIAATGVKTLQTITTDYTVAINAIADGGTVSYVVDPLVTENSLIRRVPAFTQSTDIPTVGGLSEASLEGEFDKRAIIDIYLQYLAQQAQLKQQQVSLSVVGNLVATDLDLGTVFDVDADDDFTLSDPTNPPLSGWSTRIVWRIKQDVTGSRILTLGSKFRIASDVGASIVLSTAASTTDYLEAFYNQADDNYDIISFVKGIT